MLPPYSSSGHRQACAWKNTERKDKLARLPAVYSNPLSSHENEIHSFSISQLVSRCQAGSITLFDVLMTYGKRTVYAQKAVNCVSDIMFDEALDIANHRDPTNNVDRPLLGVPVSIKDTVDIFAHDTTIGYSRNVHRPAVRSSAIVRLLQDAGALIHAKTTVPLALVSLETRSDVFGITSNPYNSNYSPGSSTGGGAALLAFGGSKIEIGTDVGGSVRIPAHFCGVYGMRSSIGRFPVSGTVSSMMGLEGIQISCSPMAGTLEDLEEFWERVVAMKPWKYDHSCIALPWRPVILQTKLKWGVIRNDGIVPPSPACKRALQSVIDALRNDGHEVVDFSPPSILDGLKIAYSLLFADGGAQLRSLISSNEWTNPDLINVLSMLSWPRWIKSALSWFYRSQDPIGSEFLEIMNTKSVLEERDLVVQRDEYRASWHRAWAAEEFDFVLTVPHALPGLEHGGTEKATLMSAGYTFIFNLLDYTAGVLPITFVDRRIDALPMDFHTTNPVAAGTFGIYDATKMHGLPVGVQIAGRRLEEEKVLAGMKVIEDAMRNCGREFVRPQF